MGLNARCAAAGRIARSDRWKPLHFIELAADSSPIGLSRAGSVPLKHCERCKGRGGSGEGGDELEKELAGGRKRDRRPGPERAYVMPLTQQPPQSYEDAPTSAGQPSNTRLKFADIASCTFLLLKMMLYSHGFTSPVSGQHSNSRDEARIS
jgi:hypothetical protein